MKKYVITKSMNRVDCVNLITKIHNELLKKQFFINKIKELNTKIKVRKHARLRGNKSLDKIYTSSSYTYNGLKMHFLIDKNNIFTNIFNISPVDSPVVQYMLIQKDETALIFTQHLLDRYNQRLLKKSNMSYKDLIVYLILNNNIGRLIFDYENTNKIVQRINEGFIYGKRYDGYIVFNTFYDSISDKDDEMKYLARKSKSIIDNLSKSDMDEFKIVYGQFLDDKITQEQLDFFLYQKGITFD